MHTPSAYGLCFCQTTPRKAQDENVSDRLGASGGWNPSMKSPGDHAREEFHCLPGFTVCQGSEQQKGIPGPSKCLKSHSLRSLRITQCVLGYPFEMPFLAYK